MGLKYAEQRRKKKSAKLTFSRLICFIKVNFTKPKVHLEKGWNSKRMITEGEAAFRYQEKSKQRSTIVSDFKTNSKFHQNLPGKIE